MKMRRYTGLLLIAAMLLTLLCGCGASASQGAPMENEMAMDFAPMEEGLAGAQSSELPLPENRKWVVTVNLQAETEDLDQMLEAVFRQVEQLQGYVENQNIHNGTAYAEYRYRSASLTVRVPADSTDRFTEQVAKNGNIVSTSRNLEDITLQYVDTEARLEALETEEARLLELMEQAETMADLLEIEGRLTDVRYEKDRITSQLRTYNNQVDYATIYLDIEEVREYTPMEEPTVWERISGGFMNSLRGVGRMFLNLFVWILAGAPWLILWGGIGALTVWLVRKAVRKKKAQKQPEKHKAERKPQAPPFPEYTRDSENKTE